MRPSRNNLRRLPPIDYPIQQNEKRKCYENQNDRHDVPPFLHCLLRHVRSHIVDFLNFYLLCLQTVVGVEKYLTDVVVENIYMRRAKGLLNFSVSFTFTGVVDFSTCL